jgi:hypothetical protein
MRLFLSKICFFITLIMLFLPRTVHAEPVDVLIKGMDDGVKTNRQQDHNEALMNAKLQAIERAGVEISSITKVVNFETKFDMVQSKADAVLMPGFQVMDVGYQADGTYMVILSGRVEVSGGEESYGYVVYDKVSVPPFIDGYEIGEFEKVLQFEIGGPPGWEAFKIKSGEHSYQWIESPMIKFKLQKDQIIEIQPEEIVRESPFFNAIKKCILEDYGLITFKTEDDYKYVRKYQPILIFGNKEIPVKNEKTTLLLKAGTHSIGIKSRKSGASWVKPVFKDFTIEKAKTAEVTLYNRIYGNGSWITFYDNVNIDSNLKFSMAPIDVY